MKTYQQELKDHLKEFLETIEVDKKKFEGEKKKNRMRLLQLQRKQQELMNAEDDIVGKQLQDNRNEFFEQLKLLKKKAQLRKNEIDAKILKNLHESHTAELKQISTSSPNTNVNPKWNILEKTAKDDQSRVKRSLFNAKTFSTYHPHSLDLKPWTTADILSLRREQFLGSNSATPPNDYHIFKNILDQSRLYHPRKRSIDDLLDISTNEIDNDISDVRDKLNDFGDSKNKYNYYSKLKKLSKIEKQNSDNQIVKEPIHTDDNLEYNITQSDKYDKTINAKVSDDSVNLKKHSHVQKLFDNEEMRTFEDMIKNITGFLSDLGKQIGSYFKNISFN